jgi:hypothetical protein
MEMQPEWRVEEKANVIDDESLKVQCCTSTKMKVVELGDKSAKKKKKNVMKAEE